MLVQPRVCPDEVAEEFGRLNIAEHSGRLRIAEHSLEVQQMIEQRQVSRTNVFLAALGFRAILDSKFMLKDRRMDRAATVIGSRSSAAGQELRWESPSFR